MHKIIINIPIEYKYYPKKFLVLLIKLKNLITLFVVLVLLLSSYERKNKIIIKQRTNSLNKITENIKVCICTLGKNENRYIKEFLNHYKNLGIDKVFLYDNNDIDNKSESFENEISEYINNSFVQIINYRGKRAPQFKIYTDCYKKNNKYYDWLIFFDIDEFIHLKDYSNIKDFLKEKKFSNCKLIYFNCLRHTDNDLLFYDNRTLATRFPIINWKSRSFTVKTIARGGIKKLGFHTSHWLDRSFRGCNVFGEVVIPTSGVKLKNDINIPKYKKYYIDHYCFKSTEEFIKFLINFKIIL